MKKKTVAIILASSMILGASSSVLASGTLKKIDAYIVSNQKITVDGSNVKTNNPVLNYNNTRYVSIRDVSKLVGAEIAYKNGVIQLETPKIVTDNNDSNSNSSNEIKDKTVKAGEFVSAGNYSFSVSDFSYNPTPESNGLYAISYKINLLTSNNFSSPDGDLTIWTKAYNGTEHAGGTSLVNIEGIEKSKSIDVQVFSTIQPSLINTVEISSIAKSDGSMLDNVKWTVK